MRSAKSKATTLHVCQPCRRDGAEPAALKDLPRPRRRVSALLCHRESRRSRRETIGSINTRFFRLQKRHQQAGRRGGLRRPAAQKLDAQAVSHVSARMRGSDEHQRGERVCKVAVKGKRVLPSVAQQEEACASSCRFARCSGYSRPHDRRKQPQTRAVPCAFVLEQRRNRGSGRDVLAQADRIHRSKRTNDVVHQTAGGPLLKPDITDGILAACQDSVDKVRCGDDLVGNTTPELGDQRFQYGERMSIPVPRDAHVARHHRHSSREAQFLHEPCDVARCCCEHEHDDGLCSMPVIVPNDEVQQRNGGCRHPSRKQITRNGGALVDRVRRDAAGK
mmetsp:Transcript_7938/g.28257  ORF Transcript_7938/g.28257 Transcript_7938/m.28257 type:complete len:334 (+) Transcript_7938:812-1813(+)